MNIIKLLYILFNKKKIELKTMLTVNEIEVFRKVVKNFTVKNPNIKKSEIVKHFMKEGFARQTIYRTLNRLNSHQSLKNNKKSGRPSSWTTARRQNLKRLVNNRKGVSQRRLAKKFTVTQPNICQQLSKMKICCKKREKTPKYDERQAVKSKKLSRKLVNLLYKNKYMVVIDDEKYFTFSGENYPGNDNYYTSDKEKCPDNVRFKGIDKYPKKVMVWIAMSAYGISKPHFRESKAEAVNGYVYLEECLKKRLLPFIEKYHQDSPYIFWPDLASSHYAGVCTEWMTGKINFVEKGINPPNIPQARPIENFWGDLSQKVYERTGKQKQKIS